MNSKSRTFAVIINVGSSLGFYFLHKETRDGESKLKVKFKVSPLDSKNKDALISLLSDAGLTVRFYDHEEKQWMDMSASVGYVPAPGNRDGTWGKPSLEEFERDYLKVV